MSHPNKTIRRFVQGIINLKQPENRDYFSAIKRDIGTLNIFLFHIIFTIDFRDSRNVILKLTPPLNKLQ